MPSPDSILPRIREVAARASGLRVLVLFGSRARGDVWTGSDWDLAYIAAGPFEPDALLAPLTEIVSGDRLDLVDLDRAGGQLRYRVARDGRVLYEAEPGLFGQFWLDAVSFWCDAQPVIQRGYDDLLRELSR